MTGAPVPEQHSETLESSPTTTPPRRRLSIRAKAALAIGAVLALTVAVAVPVTVANIRAAEIRAEEARIQAKEEGIRGEAAADAATYRDASAEAAEKKQSLADYALASQASVETLLIPVRETVVSNPEDFSEEAAAWLHDSVEGIQFVIDQHWVIPFETDSDSEDLAESAAGDQTDATLSTASEAETPLALEGDLTQLTSSLQADYLEATDEQRAGLRTYVKEATVLLREEAAYASEALLAITEANTAADDAVLAVASAAVAAGTATLEAHPSASEETLNALRSAVATSEALAGMDTSSGGLRSIGQASTEGETVMDAELAAMVESLPTEFSAYVSAAGEVRTSHQAAVAPPTPAEPEYVEPEYVEPEYVEPEYVEPEYDAPEDDAPENDGWCTWSVFMSGFPVWVWGPCSDMP